MDISLVAGVILYESTTFLLLPSKTSAGVITYEATGSLETKHILA